MSLDLMQKQMPNSYRDLVDVELDRRILAAKVELGDRLVILGHHYQREDVIQFSDFRGDSLKLSKIAALQTTADYIVFCGVHFMAETADILTSPKQKVILPDMRAGCSMADMADIDQVDEAWDILTRRFGDTILPITYVNSTAAIKAFVGKNHGATCTSSNAEEIIRWALQKKQRMLFLPDQHLGRNTAYKMGIPLNQMAVWDPINNILELPEDATETKVILWKGHCSVHQKFTLEHVINLREQDPSINILVHPECNFEVVQSADYVGSTDYIINKLENAPAKSSWAIGTEVNLVKRLAKQYTDKKIELLSTTMCPCLTMNRIDRPHLAWILDELLAGNINNQIIVDGKIKKESLLALNRMLNIPNTTTAST